MIFGAPRATSTAARNPTRASAPLLPRNQLSCLKTPTRQVTMETILGGIAVAGLGGLTVLAYKHPEGYSKLAPWLMGVPVFFVVLLGAWQSAALNFWVKLVHFVPENRYEEAKAVYERFIRPDFAVVLIVLCVWVFYLMFLLKLPEFTTKGGTNGKESGDSKAP